MNGEYTPKRIFEVARELKISTPEIIDYLADTGHDVTRKQMQPVTETMYIALLHKFDRGHFEHYLIEHGIIGDELRRLTGLLDEQKKKAVKSLPPPRGEPAKVTRLRAPRKVRAPMEKSETIKVTFFRRERPVQVSPPPTATPQFLPSSVFARIGEQPASIPTSPITLQLIKLILALSNERKQTLVSQLRQRDPR